ncbi:response regulator transcription factor [Sporosarcina siberiensis]|uniref:Response regulator transcription factor n=1 Tax=Sporosarcina siberiensis TaxID=1365606 RepID=A0ABW4SGW1_9BACL
MDNTITELLNQDSKNKSLHISFLKRFFDIRVAMNVRFKSSFSLVFISIVPGNNHSEQNEGELKSGESVTEKLNAYLNEQVRNSDLVFQTEKESEWIMLLTNSGEEETRYFLKRLIRGLALINNVEGQESFYDYNASIVEVASTKADFVKVLLEGQRSLRNALQLEPSSIHTVSLFQKRENERIKVSIIEEDLIVTSILQTVLERNAFDYFDLDIQTFQDGHDFLQSDWYLSSHTHLIVMNDILPKQNGIEVLRQLRNMPNQQKYLVFMMSRRKTEDDMIYIYENGVDEYVMKPINIRLFEAQVKKVLKRLGS